MSEGDYHVGLALVSVFSVVATHTVVELFARRMSVHVRERGRRGYLVGTLSVCLLWLVLGKC